MMVRSIRTIRHPCSVSTRTGRQRPPVEICQAGNPLRLFGNQHTFGVRLHSRPVAVCLPIMDATSFSETRPLPVAAESVSTPPPPRHLAIETHDLTRCFGEFTAVNRVNLAVPPGRFFGFLGTNGAGKSTTIKMLTGLLAPSAGSIQVLGQSLAASTVELKRQIGVVPEGMALFGRLTAPEYARFVGRRYGLDEATRAQRSAELLDFMNLAGESKKLITDFSHGMQKKLALSAAVMHAPRVLFLDEPFEGVDAVAAGTLKSMLQRMIARGATVFLTSHVLEIVERLCDHVAILQRGSLVAQGSLEELRAGVEARHTGVGTTGRATLEEIFLSVLGTSGVAPPEQELSWLC